MKKQLSILVSPLNWGLGHASRLVPIIELFLAEGVEVVLAASGNAAQFLSKSFPTLELLATPDLEVRYGKHALLSTIFQSDKLLQLIKDETSWLQELLLKRKFDAVISDNRYGLRHPSLQSVFISHQLNPGRNIASAKIFSSWINNFDEVWVPDISGEGSLSGKLSVNNRINNPIKHLGVFSRLHFRDSEKKYAHIAVLSGPEQQRTLFENAVAKEFAALKQPCVIVRGGFNLPEPDIQSENIFWVQEADATELEQLLSQSQHIICRSGYSSLLDLCSNKRSATLVPTPGQTEQTYLAERVLSMGWFSVQEQSSISIGNAENVKVLPDFKDYHKEVISAFLRKLNS